MNNNLDDFITDAPVKTPSMTIKLYNKKKELERSFVAPPGFQWDRYLREAYPDRGWSADQPRNNILKLYFTN